MFSTGISDEGLTAVAKSIKGLKNLESVSFGLGETIIEKDNTLEELGASL